jgi:DNA primase
VPLGEIIDYLQLQRRGRAFRCPNGGAHKHGDRTRSAYIAETWDSWRCYGCEAFGSVIDVYRYACDVTKEAARDALAEYAGLVPAYGATTRSAPPPLPHEIPKACPSPEAALPSAAHEVVAFLARAQQALQGSPGAQGYLRTRGIPLPVAIEAGLGFAPRGTWPHRRGRGQPRVVAPLTAPDGTLLNLYGRSTVDCDKAVRHDFLPGPKGIFHAGSLAVDGCILVEGIFDALACLAGGRPSAAIMGLSLRDGWWLEMRASRYILAPDADAAGQRRREELRDTGARAGKEVFALKPECLAGCKDLNEFWTTHGRLPTALQQPLPAPQTPRSAVTAKERPAPPATGTPSQTPAFPPAA